MPKIIFHPLINVLVRKHRIKHANASKKSKKYEAIAGGKSILWG